MAPCLRLALLLARRDWLGPVPSLHAHPPVCPGKGTVSPLLELQTP